MCRRRRLAGLLGFSVIAAIGSPAFAEATIEFTIRGPMGMPLADAAVNVWASQPTDVGGKPITSVLRTDGEGLLRLTLTHGPSFASVRVPGVGFGATLPFSVPSTGTLRVELPPLVPFGEIAGTVPREHLRPGLFVTLPDPMSRGAAELRVSCDDEGKFVVADLPPGRYELRPRTDAGPLDIVARTTVFPGERTTRVTFHRERPRPPVVPKTPTSPWEEKPTTWCVGTVRDEAGRPIAGARVFAAFFAGMLLPGFKSIQSAESDAEGHWKLHGVDLTRRSEWNGFLAAAAPGHRPATVSVSGSHLLATVARNKDDSRRRFDLILPRDAGELTVRVLAAGRPLPNCPVLIIREQDEFDWPARGHLSADEEPYHELFEAIVRPVVQSDATGAARFANLSPGTYRIVAVEGEADLLPILDEERADGRLEEVRYARCFGVPVRVGETREFTVQLEALARRRALTLRRPDGAAADDQKVAIDCERPGSHYEPSQLSREALQLDPAGMAPWQFRERGLWQVSLKYRDEPIRYLPILGPPRYEAGAVVGISPLLEMGPIPPLTARYFGPGSLRVELRDADDRPVRGYVTSSLNDRPPTFCASTDEAGTVVWKGNPYTWIHLIGHVPGLKVPELDDDGPPPSDDELIGRTMMLSQEARPAEGVETTVTLRPQPVGYVRGVVEPPPGASAGDYRIVEHLPPPTTAYRVRYDAATGEFLLGPVPIGWQRLMLADDRADFLSAVCATVDVEVRADRVASTVFKPPAHYDETVPPYLLDIVSSNRDRRPARGRVFMPDGTTPAHNARVLLFQSTLSNRLGSAITDADGRFVTQSSVSWSAPGMAAPISQTGPRLVAAYLPGSCGLIVQTFVDENDDDVRIVLPQSFHLRGRVTLGGEPAAATGNRFRVAAVRNGEPALDDHWRAKVTPQADGSFELGGLVAGAYRLQAAFDGIWLSKTIEATVAEKIGDDATEPVVLDVGKPGPPVVVHCRTPSGKPVPGAVVELRRPPGPLAERLWPPTLTADGAGTIHLPPLEVGTHKLNVRGSVPPQQVKVPPIPPAGIDPIESTLIVE